MRIIISILMISSWFFSCSSTANRQAEEQVENKTLLRVDNRNFSDMTIYVLRAGERVRLGTVTGNSKRVLVIPEYLISGVSALQFLADPIGGRSTPITEQMTVAPGEEVQLIITN
jgi:hypothetical protein